MVVYAIVNNITLKLYVGQHNREDDLGKYFSKKYYVANHNTSGARSHLYAALAKHPRETWSIHPLVSGIETKQELDECERLLIYALKAQHPDIGYNICDGGEGFTGPHTAAAKAAITAALTNRPVSEETRAKIGAANAITAKGHICSAENKAKLSAALKGRRTSTGMLGHKFSDETKAKMRESAQRRGISAETRTKIIESCRTSEKCRTHPSYVTPEGVEKMRQSKLGKPWSAARRAAYNKTFCS